MNKQGEIILELRSRCMKLENSLARLMQRFTGNLGQKDGNPYQYYETKYALQVLANIVGEKDIYSLDLGQFIRYDGYTKVI